jgi:hypothetical protein
MEPRFLNLEYVFNFVYQIYLWGKYFVLFKLGNTSASEYVNAHKGDDYDGLLERFNIAGGGPTNAGLYKYADGVKNQVTDYTGISNSTNISDSADSVYQNVANGADTTYSISSNGQEGASNYLNSLNNGEGSTNPTTFWDSFKSSFGFDSKSTAGVGSAYNNTSSVYGSGASQITSSNMTSGIPDNFIGAFLGSVRDIMTLLAILVIVWYVFSIIRWKEISEEYDSKFDKYFNDDKKEKLAPHKAITTSQKWPVVEAHMASGKESEYRLAILEADNMLGDLLDSLGFEGKDIGEQLKNLKKEKFKNLDEAWSAHKVRNRIAHEGSDFVLTEREALNTVALYKKIFQDFKFI